MTLPSFLYYSWQTTALRDLFGNKFQFVLEYKYPVLRVNFKRKLVECFSIRGPWPFWKSNHVNWTLICVFLHGTYNGHNCLPKPKRVLWLVRDDGEIGKGEEKELPFRFHVSDESCVTTHAYTSIFRLYLQKRRRSSLYYKMYIIYYVHEWNARALGPGHGLIKPSGREVLNEPARRIFGSFRVWGFFRFPPYPVRHNDNDDGN